MRKKILHQKTVKFFQSAPQLLLLLICVSLSAQVQNNGSLYIGDSGRFYVGGGAYNFGASPATTQTTRTATIFGKIHYAAGVTTTGAADSHFLDGYCTVTSTAAFLAPVGNSTIYAPLRITPSTTAEASVAYNRSNPLTGRATLDATVQAVSTIEFWDVIGTNSANVTLTWRSSSNLSSIVTNVSDITIAGYDGSKWVALASTVDATSILGGVSTITAGSISLTSSSSLATYRFFALASKANACPPIVASSGFTRTYTGGAWDTVPTLADAAVISTAYSGGSFQCNSLILNANATLSNGQYAEIVNGVTGTGSFILSSEASVVQRSNSLDKPKIELTKRTTNKRQYDYIYWGTPIAGDFFSQIASAQASTAAVANAFDRVFRRDSGTNGGWFPLSATSTGKGFITRVAAAAPFLTPTATDFINFKFTGTANNGDVPVSINSNTADFDEANSYVLLANPYPSAIDADKLLTDNADIDGVVYIWTSATSNNGPGGQAYGKTDYIAYTKAGSTGLAVNGISTTPFNGKIASGQGFMARAIAPTGTGTVTFTNCMRLTADNNQFNRTTSDTDAVATKDRFKVNFKKGDFGVGQILVAYLPQATMNYDRMYDASLNSASSENIYSFSENVTQKLAINARPAFFDTDVVKIGLSKENALSEICTLELTQQEGIFANGQSVYVHDKALGVYHNLTTSNYLFTTDVPVSNARFEIVYQATLSTANASAAINFANITKNVLTISTQSSIKKIEIFDVAGRLIKTINTTETNLVAQPFNHADGVYVAKVTLVDGGVGSAKLVNSNN